MSEQAGIYRIELYEAKGLEVTYNSLTDVRVFSTTGQTVTIENGDCLTMWPNLEWEIIRGASNRAKYIHTITWDLLGLSDTDIDTISALKSSIYGWVALIEFYNGTSVFIENPFRFVRAEINNAESNHYDIEIRNVVAGGFYKSYTPPTGEVITADSDVVTADSDTVDASGATI